MTVRCGGPSGGWRPTSNSRCGPVLRDAGADRKPKRACIRDSVRSTGYVIECTIECWPGKDAPVTFRIMESGETVILKPDEYEIVEFMDEDPDRKSGDKPSP